MSASVIFLGRKRRWGERMDARFPEGTLARMDALRRPKEARTDFIHEAVKREIGRRDRLVAKAQGAAGGGAQEAEPQATAEDR